MQGQEISKLLAFLKDSKYVNFIHYVEDKEYGFDDGKGHGYLRLATDNAATNFYRDRDGNWTAEYYLVLDTSGNDKDEVLKYYVGYLETFTNASIRVTSVGIDNDAIYLEETKQENRTDCEFIRIAFDLVTLENCFNC